MSQLIHAVARIRVLESEMLSEDSANRMISASTFESAYAVLDELGYAKESSVFRDTYNYEGAIESGLSNTLGLFKTFEIGKVLKLLTVIVDIQNIILYVKAIDALSSEENIDTLVDESEVISYGYYSKDVLDTAFIAGEAKPGYEELYTLVQKLEEYKTLEEKELFVESEIIKQAEKEGKSNKFLNAFLSFLKNSEGLKKDVLKESQEVLLQKYPDYKNIIERIFVEKSKQNQVSLLEILLDEKMVSFLREQSSGKIDGYEVLFSFFWRKERNSRVIRSILLAKKSGFSPEEIKADFDAFIF